MKKFLDADHPFFAAPWRRWATGLVPLVWGAVELWLGNPGWALVFAAAGAFALYVLVIKAKSNNE